jgi:glycosyltransferase involved in cell wall biosynthesis
MEIAHVVNSITGTSIPVEIAAAIDKFTDFNVRIVSLKQQDIPQPDIVPELIIDTKARSFNGYRTLVRYLERQDVDIIHSHHNRSAVALGYHCFHSPMLHVNTQHGHLHYTIPQKILNLITLFLADTLVYNSHKTSKSYNFIEGIVTQNTDEVVVHNGVNSDVISSYQANNESVTTLVTAARLIPRKNVDRIIKAVSRIEGLSLKIIGDGQLRETLKTKAIECGVSNRIEFFGYVADRRDVYEILSTGDIFVLPSHSEGFCVAVAEAMAIGLPVIVSDIPVFHEVVGDKGLFVDQNSTGEIESAIRTFCSDKELLKETGDKLRERALDRFTLENTAKGYGNVYQQTLNED